MTDDELKAEIARLRAEVEGYKGQTRATQPAQAAPPPEPPRPRTTLEELAEGQRRGEDVLSVWERITRRSGHHNPFARKK